MAKAVEAEVNTKGPGKQNAVVEGHKEKRALASEVGVATARVKPLVLMRVLISEKYRGAEGEVFVCLGQMVLRTWIDESVKLRKVEAVGKVVGWEANGLASVMVESAKLKAEVAGAEVLVVDETSEAVEVVEKFVVAVAADDGKILNEEGTWSGNAVGAPLDEKEMGGEEPNQDEEVDPLEGVVVVDRSKGAAVEEDSQTEAAEAAVCQMGVGVGVGLWMVVGEVGVLRMAEEAGARDLSGKMRRA